MIRMRARAAWVRRALAAAVAGAAFVAVPAAGQDLTAYATASIDGYDTNVQLVGASVRPGGLGLQPVLGVQVFHLGFNPSGPGSVDRFGVTPSVGASYRMPTGSVEARVGYTIQNEDNGPIVDGAGGKDGFNVALQGNYWGTGGGPELQGIATYSISSDYTWNQAQATVPVATYGTHAIKAGAEAVFESATSGPSYHAYSVGPLVRVTTSSHSSFALSGGFKDSNTRAGTWYARAGFVVYGIHL